MKGLLHNAAIFAVAVGLFVVLTVIVALGGKHALDEEFDN